MKTKRLLLTAVIIFMAIAIILLYLRSQQVNLPGGDGAWLDKPYVDERELGCARCDFERYFAVKTEGQRGSLVPDILVQLGSFNEKLTAALAADNSEDIGIIIHHGLGSAGAISFVYSPEIEFVGLKDLGDDEWEVVDIEDSQYSIDGNGILSGSNGTDGWSLYKAHMFLHVNSRDAISDPNFDHAPAVTEGIDVQHYLFRFTKRFKKLLDQNSDLDATHLKLISIAEPLQHVGDEMEGMRHHVSVALCKDDGQGGVVELVDGESYWPNNYRMKALDVGSPCPYRCATAYLPKNGTPIRRTCTPHDQSCTHNTKHYNLAK